MLCKSHRIEYLSMTHQARFDLYPNNGRDSKLIVQVIQHETTTDKKKREKKKKEKKKKKSELSNACVLDVVK